MRIVQYAAPTIEPISLAELKLHLRLDSGSLSDNLGETQSIAPGSHATTTGYALLGTSIDIFGKSAIVYLQSGTNGATGTVDVKIQDSDNGTTWTDWGSAFTQITTSNDNATFEQAYTGVKRYIRTVAQVLLAACEFGTSVLVVDPTSAEDSLLTAIIQASREYVEDLLSRKLLTQTWDYYLDDWPHDRPEQHYRYGQKRAIDIPFGNLQSVTTVAYKDAAGTTTTLTENTDYYVEKNGEMCGRVVRPYGMPWPLVMLWPSQPIAIRFICGWASAALIPGKIKSAMLMIAADLYANREAFVEATSKTVIAENLTVGRLLSSMKLWDEF